MKQWIVECVRLVGLTVLIAEATEVLAAPTSVSVTPPQGARFLTGQKFDIRVEGQGTGPYTASLAVDGVPVEFTSGALTGGIKNLQNLPSDSSNFDPLVAPQRQRVVGTYDFAGFPHYTMAKDGYPESFDIDGKILIGYGASADRWEGWLTKPRPVIDSLLPSDITAKLVMLGYPGQVYERSENQLGFYIRGQADGRAQAVHTASDIPVSAYSSGSNAHHQFHGVQTNTDVFFKLMRAALGGY